MSFVSTSKSSHLEGVMTIYLIFVVSARIWERLISGCISLSKYDTETLNRGYSYGFI